MNKFEKVSVAQYAMDRGMAVSEIAAEYENIRLPMRATKGSAGYDFRSPIDFTLKPGETIRIATGIRVFLDENKVLLCFPRSGLGFKFRTQLDNTVGIIDSDYVKSYNEGHIMIKLTNDSKEGKDLSIKAGDAFIQGIVMPYFLMDDDEVEGERNGGFGSTDKKEPVVEAPVTEDILVEMLSEEEEVMPEIFDFEPLPAEDVLHNDEVEAAPKIVLYTTHCPKCKILAQKLDKKNVQYEVIDDIDEMEKLNIMSAPQLKVGSNLMDYLAAVKWCNSLEG